MRESKVRQIVSKVLLGSDPHPVENTCGNGMPDVCFIGGWVELKVAPKWPVKENTPLRLAHYTADQRLWHRNHQRAGGRVFVLIVVDKDWILLDGYTASKYLGYATKSQLTDLAIMIWWGKLQQEELRSCLLKQKILHRPKSCSSLDEELA